VSHGKIPKNKTEVLDLKSLPAEDAAQTRDICGKEKIGMIEVYLDCASPWSYFGFEGVQPLAAEFGETLLWRPVLVGGIFNAVNSSVYHVREHVPAKMAYNAKDIQDWARNTGKVVKFPPRIFPVNSAAAMRVSLVLAEQDEKLFVLWVRAVYEAYWSQDQDIADPAVLAGIADSLGWEGAQLVERANAPTIRTGLRANTDEAIARGVFGVPTFFLDGDDMYFGADRLPNLKHALLRKYG
jgi:2-hydroxychromene-2-carboxylate isomerase